MKRKEVNENFIIETFSNYTELLKVCDTRSVNDEFINQGRINTDYYWTGCRNYDEARNYLQFGYSKNIDYIKSQVKELQKQGEVKKVSTYEDVVGFAPIVPNAILGLPNSMINTRRVTKKNKVITIVYNSGVASRINKKTVMDRGIEVMNQIINLEKQGYRVKLESMISFNDKNKHYIMKVTIKNEFNPIDIKRVAFPLMVAGMQRHIGFDWYERCPKVKKLDAYGHEISYCTQAEKEEILKEVLSGNEYFIDKSTDLDDVFRKMR